MRRLKRFLTLVGILVVALLGIWMVRPACACVPLEYAEVAVADLPETARKDLEASAPGLVPERAWIFGIGPDLARGRGRGYLIRGRTAGAWWSHDVKVPFGSGLASDGELELRPVP